MARAHGGESVGSQCSSSSRNPSPSPAHTQKDSDYESLPSSAMQNDLKNATPASPRLSEAELFIMVRDAAVCMMRKPFNNDPPTLRKYLATRFPGIPAEARDPIIFATFTAAQKAALNYMDTLLGESNEKAIWAKTCLFRWSHGLGINEPPPVYTPTENLETVNPEAYSPSTNYLMTKQLPVPWDSQKHGDEAQKDFDSATEQIMLMTQSGNVSGAPRVDDLYVTNTLV